MQRGVVDVLTGIELPDAAEQPPALHPVPAAHARLRVLVALGFGSYPWRRLHVAWNAAATFVNSHRWFPIRKHASYRACARATSFPLAVDVAQWPSVVLQQKSSCKYQKAFFS